MAKRKFKETEHYHAYPSLWNLIKMALAEKLDKSKELAYDPDKTLVRPTPPNMQVNYLAVVLDGEVQEVMRADNRLAALLLSSPEFVEYDPWKDHVHIGVKFKDGHFEEDSEEAHNEGQ